MMSYLRWTFYQTKIFSVPDVLNGFDINKIQYIHVHHFHVIDVIQSKLLTLKYNDVVVSSKNCNCIITARFNQFSFYSFKLDTSWKQYESKDKRKLFLLSCLLVLSFNQLLDYMILKRPYEDMRIVAKMVFGGIKVFYFYTTNSKP